uniref:Uncharacterized protein n=1 Tax=Hyaloperonospora arabidopsidis (strain Emoy2) TaxID=559515 RepID=M4BFK8_HYAAE
MQTYSRTRLRLKFRMIVVFGTRLISFRPPQGGSCSREYLTPFGNHLLHEEGYGRLADTACI